MGKITDRVEFTFSREQSKTSGIEIIENTVTHNLPYKIHYQERESGDITRLNFSNSYTPYENGNAFPEYTAKLEETFEDCELWTVNTPDSAEEVRINSTSRKDELAYKLENAYDAVINH